MESQIPDAQTYEVARHIEERCLTFLPNGNVIFHIDGAADLIEERIEKALAVDRARVVKKLKELQAKAEIASDRNILDNESHWAAIAYEQAADIVNGEPVESLVDIL
jgi:uncharacterized protein (DUF1697 family)